MWNKLFAVVIFFLILSGSVQAQVYKCENGLGEINFSDEPCAKGEKAERLKWLKNATSGKKKRPAQRALTQAQKTAKKAKKENQAYVLLSLMTTTQLELETASLRSTLKGETTKVPELVLPDGITVDLLKVDKIILTYKKSTVQARFIMDDGYEEVKTIKKPFPVISGAARIGRFSKSLQDIKKIEFFNSKKLLKMAAKKAGKKLSARKTSAKNKPLADNTQSPVIELDLSHQVATNDAPKKKKTIAKSAPKKAKIKVVDKDSAKKPGVSAIQLVFVNDKKITLQRDTLSSSKGGRKSNGSKFIVSDKEQIPYEAIKTIKMRSTAKNQLIVAIELKTKEIKMQVMPLPYTRIIGKSTSGSFNHSLLEIKSVSFVP